jgi:polyisoprenyl-teichoic acid--peptidoglycan teichoic acid transferase
MSIFKKLLSKKALSKKLLSKELLSKPIAIAPALSKGWILVLGTIAAAGLGALVSVTIPLPGTVAPREGQRLLGDLFKNGFRYQVKRPVNILVMGIDRVADAKPGSDEMFSGNSDSLLLLHLDPNQRSLNVLSVPRDTQVEIPSLGLTKINQANPSGGPALTGKVISDTLGGVTIDRYVRFSTDAFRELIDQVGGIEVNVPADMNYEDKTQKLYIDLKRGQQTLDGNKAEQFARFRNDNLGDIGRVQRQQTLLKALREKLSSPMMLPRIPGIVQRMQKYIDTNLTLEETSALLNYGLGLDQKTVKMVLLPGRFSGPKEFQASYWILEPDARDRIMKEYFDVGAGQADSSTSALRIVIQNASDNPEAAQNLEMQLAKAGYEDVRVLDDRPETQTQTQIIVQGGQTQAAAAIQHVIGIGILETSSTGELESDITLRLGNDLGKQKL